MLVTRVQLPAGALLLLSLKVAHEKSKKGTTRSLPRQIRPAVLASENSSRVVRHCSSARENQQFLCCAPLVQQNYNTQSLHCSRHELLADSFWLDTSCPCPFNTNSSCEWKTMRVSMSYFLVRVCNPFSGRLALHPCPRPSFCRTWFGRSQKSAEMDTLGFEPRAFRMRSGCDNTTPCALCILTVL